MFEIIFLGTSASAPSVHRGLTSSAILAGEHRFLIDCGEGTQRQILRSGIGFKRLHRILLTHSHLDHILGLGGLVSTFVRWESMDSLEIWGGRPTLQRVEALLGSVVLRNEIPPIPIHMRELRAGPFITEKDFSVHAIPVNHRGGGNFGFVFQEKTHRPFLVEEAERLGIAPGPERGKLVRGETVISPNGITVTPDMVLGPAQIGARLVYVGDVGKLDNLREHVEGANALVIESTFLDVEAEMAQQFGHITARQAALLAQSTGVQTLLLNHVSRRYRERDIVDEARSIFPNSYVVRDFDHFVIPRGAPAYKKGTAHASPEDNESG
jgi:ribonuclease Z